MDLIEQLIIYVKIIFKFNRMDSAINFHIAFAGINGAK